jgi:hypothetical protein
MAAAGGAGTYVLLLLPGVRAARVGIGVATEAAAAVDLDTVSLAGDAVALAAAVGAQRGGRGPGRIAGAGRGD